MKPYKLITKVVFFLVLIFVASSCVVVRKDNGKHRGWFKYRNNPHHPKTINPGKSEEKNAGKSVGKKKKLTVQSVHIGNLHHWQVKKPS